MYEIRRWLSLAALALVLFRSLPPARGETDPPKVRLVVLLVVDQLRADYLTRFGPHFGEDGFALLTKRGAHFLNAHYSYGATSTAPGHATIATGRLPRQHGIVSNEWHLDPESATDQSAVDDPKCELIGLPPGQRGLGRSPRNLIGPALGDQMKLMDRRTRVFGVSLKARSAILPAGKKPDGAFWWNDTDGGFLSSTYYFQKPPAYIEDYNQTRWTDRYAGQEWKLLLPEAAYAGCQPDAEPWIPANFPLGATFPHKLPAVAGERPDKTFYTMLYCTPFGNELVLEIARRILVEEKLGQGPAPDLLCVSLSSNDACGHVFGPDSPEVMDITLCTDRQLAAFFKLLDEQVGLKHCLIALSADHGVTSVSHVTKPLELGGGRLNLRRVKKALNTALAETGISMPNGHEHILGIQPPWVYFDRSIQKLDAEKRDKLLEAGARALRQIEGVAEVFTANELAGPPPARDDLYRWLAWRCYHPQRSGELYMQISPHWYEEGGDAAGHSAGFSYDRHVPIALFGPGVRPGRYFAPADPLDIVPTLAALLGIEPPLNPAGRVLNEALE